MSVNKLANLHGRQAMITGALGELGRVMAHTLAELGADILLVDKPGLDFNLLKEELSKWKVNVTIAPCDISLEVERKKLIKSILNESSSLSILINNAAFVGTSELPGWATPFEQQSLDTWRKAFEVNLTAVFDFCQGLAPLLKKSPGANIINIGSIYGIHGPDWRLYENTHMSNPAAYACSKGGLIQLTRWLSTTLAPEIRVNTISPGGILRGQPNVFINRYVSRTPLKRMGEPLDIVGPLTLLSTDLGSYITGHNLILDGGWSAW